MKPACHLQVGDLIGPRAIPLPHSASRTAELLTPSGPKALTKRGPERRSSASFVQCFGIPADGKVTTCHGIRNFRFSSATKTISRDVERLLMTGVLKDNLACLLLRSLLLVGDAQALRSTFAGGYSCQFELSHNWFRPDLQDVFAIQSTTTPELYVLLLRMTSQVAVVQLFVPTSQMSQFIHQKNVDSTTLTITALIA